jgi:hypothetical protein
MSLSQSRLMVDGDSGYPYDLPANTQKRQLIPLLARHLPVDENLFQTTVILTTERLNSVPRATASNRDLVAIGKRQTHTRFPATTLKHPRLDRAPVQPENHGELGQADLSRHRKSISERRGRSFAAVKDDRSAPILDAPSGAQVAP